MKPGDSIAHYEVLSPIGKGGMGEVYRARDTKLKRDVALKVLAPEVASDPDRLMRFQREAELLASLNHPNVAQVYGVEKHALVMELVEGENLKCPLPLKTALEYACQIAEALEYAHEKGLVHRDLKPANVMITPQGAVKLLDFGLAKAVEKAAYAGNADESPTATLESTRAGMIMGTAAYMSPEQAAGKAVDKRSDVWSFGVLLWEMLTAERLFQRPSMAETLADVLRAEIDFKQLPPDVPEPVRELLARCLDRDPTTRLRDLGEARVVLRRYLADSSVASTTPKTFAAARPPKRRRRVWFAAGGLSAVVAAAIAFVLYANRPMPVVGPLHSQQAVTLPEAALAAVETAASAVASAVSPNQPKPVPGPEHWKQITNFSDAATNPALSRDGDLLAFTRGSGWFMGNNEIYVKPLPDGAAVPYTSDGLPKMFPAFSPDGTRIAFTVRGFNTWSVPVLGGGQPELMLEQAEGLTWIDAHQILFSEGKGGGRGMGVETAREDRSSQREIYMPAKGMAHFSSLSPDGKQLLVVEMRGTGPFTPCRLMPFDGSTSGRQVGPMGKGGARCTAAAWSPDGKWMYFTADEGHGSHVWRQRVDNDTPEQITFGPMAQQGLAIAPDGKSLYTSVGDSHPSLWIHDAKGERQISGEGTPGQPTFSRDGTHLYYLMQNDSSSDLWVADLKTGRSKLALPSATPIGAFFLSPDGKSFLYFTGGKMWVVGLDPPSPPHDFPVPQQATPVMVRVATVAWGASGQLYFVGEQGGEARYYTFKLDGTPPQPLADSVLAGGGDLRFVALSPDEKWVTHGGLASPLAGGPAVELCDCIVRWSSDAKAVLYTFRVLGNGEGTTVAVPLKGGEMFPAISPGRHTPEELAKLPGAVVIPFNFPEVGPKFASWVYVKANTQQNIFQVPLQ